jgi:uncharacterized protein
MGAYVLSWLMSMTSKILSPELVKAVVDGYELSINGVHGPSHWFRVRENGLFIANENGANARVVQLFSLFHDSKRENDGHDPLHGARGAAFAIRLRAKGLFEVTDLEMESLVFACTNHTQGWTAAPLTVATCWDGDRLDLGRVGYVPDPKRLCTDVGRRPEVIEWAYGRSLG